MKPRIVWILTIVTLPVALFIVITAPLWSLFRWCVCEWHDSIDKMLERIKSR